MTDVYKEFIHNNVPFIYTNIESAEMIKYANNAYLAMKVSFVNEIANLCEKCNANIKYVTRALGQDSRIGPHFLQSGPGYGGSCFPKDTYALAHIGRQLSSPMTLVETLIEVNTRQKINMVSKIESALEDLSNRSLAILGLTFKPNTNDIRESPSITIMEELCKRGACLKVFDPQGMDEAKQKLFNLVNIECCENEYTAIN